MGLPIQVDGIKCWACKDELLSIPVFSGHADPFVADFCPFASLAAAVLVSGIALEAFDEFLDCNSRRSDGRDLNVSLGEFKSIEDFISGWYSCGHLGV